MMSKPNRTTRAAQASARRTAPRPSTMPNFMVSCYLIVMFSIFPLFLSEKYFHARRDKYYFYLIVSAVAVISVIIATLTDYFEQKRCGEARLGFLPLSAADIAFLCFFGFAVVSTLLSGRISESYFGIYYEGNDVFGRNNGLLLLMIYVLVYFVISRKYVDKSYIVLIFIIFSSLIALLSVVNFFHIDPLGLFDADYKNKETVIKDFSSTLGNKNLASSFICIFLPVSVMFFVLKDNALFRLISGVGIAVGYSGLLCVNSASGILGISVAIVAMAVFCARDYHRFKWFTLSMAILFAGGKLLRLFSLLMQDNSKGFEFIQDFLIYHKIMYLPIVVFAGLFCLLHFGEKKLLPHYPKRALPIALLTVGILSAAAFVGTIIHFTFTDTTTDLGSFKKLLRFDQYWGTHRGYYWIYGTENFFKQDLLHRIFGAGPDSAFLVLNDLQKFDISDNMHNEFLNYLVTQGVLGLLGYAAILVSLTVRVVRRAKHDPRIMIFFSAVICYVAQSVVNLYQPITTPLFFIFIALTEAMNRRVSPKQTAEKQPFSA